MSEIKNNKAQGERIMTEKAWKFVSKVGDHESVLKSDFEASCKASKVVMEVLKTGDVPEGLKLQYAPSYNAHFINRKGRNALGFFSTNNLLVVNGIEAELRDKGYAKDLIHPQTSKKYWGIRLADKDAAYLKKLVNDAAAILGFKAATTGKKLKPKTKKAKKVAAEAIA